MQKLSLIYCVQQTNRLPPILPDSLPLHVTSSHNFKRLLHFVSLVTTGAFLAIENQGGDPYCPLLKIRSEGYLAALKFVLSGCCAGFSRKFTSPQRKTVALQLNYDCGRCC